MIKWEWKGLTKNSLVPFGKYKHKIFKCQEKIDESQCFKVNFIHANRNLYLRIEK
jgi:hypothetical protein